MSSKFVIAGEDILENYHSHLRVIYRVDGANMARAYLDSIVRAAKKKPELYKELLPAIMELKIVSRILKEVNSNDRRTEVGANITA